MLLYKVGCQVVTIYISKPSEALLFYSKTTIMITKIFSQCYSFIVKDFGMLKALFIILASLLITEEFYNFLVLKPTYTFQEKRRIDLDDFPVITLCPHPSVDVNAMKKKGYGLFDFYFKGVFDPFNSSVSWAGNKSEDVKEVSKEISILKSIDDCPEGQFHFEDNSSIAEFKLSRALNPYHICCQVIQPKLSEASPIVSLRLFLNNSQSLLSYFKVFLADQLTASIFDQHKTVMTGDTIASNNKGFMMYKVKIVVDEKLEGDPKYPCIDFKFKGEYAKCIENELIKQNTKFLNCSPPWMTENEDLWCRKHYKMDQKTQHNYFSNFMGAIGTSDADYGKCLIPCKRKRYEAKKIGLLEKNGTRGLIIRFDKDVEITKSSWTIDVKSLLSSVGGTIGLSKELLWLLILTISSVGVIKSHLKKCFQYV